MTDHPPFALCRSDAEPKYLIAVQPVPTNEVKKKCTGSTWCLITVRYLTWIIDLVLKNRGEKLDWWQNHVAVKVKWVEVAKCSLSTQRMTISDSVLRKGGPRKASSLGHWLCVTHVSHPVLGDSIENLLPGQHHEWLSGRWVSSALPINHWSLCTSAVKGRINFYLFWMEPHCKLWNTKKNKKQMEGGKCIVL